VLNATHLLGPWAVDRGAHMEMAGVGLGDGELPHDMLLRIGSFLGARDLGRLQSVARRFAQPVIAAAATAATAAKGEASEEEERWSVVDEVARRWLDVRCGDVVRELLLQREGRQPWLALMREAEALSIPLSFARANEHVILSDKGSVVSVPSDGGQYLAAASDAVLGPLGRHFAEFTVVEGDAIYLGLIRPSWALEGDGFHSYPFTVHEHCFFDTTDGRAYPYDISWEGMQEAGPGDRVGLLLDLDRGSLAVYKNGRRLGVMVPCGLKGEYSWAVALWRGSVRIAAAA
jgi:hypothetical protein